MQKALILSKSSLCDPLRSRGVVQRRFEVLTSSSLG